MRRSSPGQDGPARRERSGTVWAVAAPGFLLAASWCLMASAVPAQEPLPTQVQDSAAGEVDEDRAAPRGAGDRPADPKEEERTLTIGFLLLAGVVFVGLCLVLFVVLWGMRTRRMTRKPLTPVGRRDELWYLKPPRTEATERLPGEPEQNPPEAP